MGRVRSQRDFGVGIIYFTLGIGGAYIARDYTFGTSGRMGPGYFPTIISILLILIGSVTIIRSLLHDGPPIGKINWKGMFIVTLSVCSFGYLLAKLGLPIAMAVMILIAAAASERFRFEVRAAIGLVLLIGFCTAIFVKGLGVPMPIFGEWLSR